jgi:hypothetical protein
MLKHRAAAHVNATHVPIEPRVITKGIARVKLIGDLYVGRFGRVKAVHRRRHTLSLAI